MSNEPLNPDEIVTLYTLWEEIVEKGLRGKPFSSLQDRTEDGIIRGPLKTHPALPSLFAPQLRCGAPLLEGRPWHITAPVRDPELAHANKQALGDLLGGASALRITLGRKGIDIKNANEMKRLLDKVHTSLAPVVIAPNNDTSNTDKLKDFTEANIYLGFGPKTEDLQEILKELPESWRLITINAARVHDMGGTEAQELAYFATSAVHAFRVLGQDAAKHIGVELTTNQDAHLSIAKLRAARRIYARIAESFGAEDARLTLHSISSMRMMQSEDPWTNMLRVMSASFGAVIGGADFITTRPFTDANGHATGFGHRLARNMQLMMMEESHLGQVQDAAYGSYFHESMTKSLAQAAWTEFQQIESEGGLLNIEPFKARIKDINKAREEKADSILGVDLHPLEKGSTAYREPKIRRANP
jgi:methylmalonyl-CoA mutase